jgi:hypothetical protein
MVSLSGTLKKRIDLQDFNTILPVTGSAGQKVFG